jgi:hypothetical protein
MKSFKQDNLEIETREENGTMFLLWNGTSTTRDPASSLGTYLYEILEQPVSHEKFVFNLSKLQFMNSSAIAVLMHFIEKLKGQSTQCEIVFSKEKDWQDVLFRTMKVIASRMNNVTVSKL